MTSLLAFGCSNTRGAEAINDYDIGISSDEINIQHAYPKYVAELLGYNYHNYAKNGISNQEIATCVINTITSHPDTSDIFVLIGWTDDDRLPVVKTPSIDFRYDKKNTNTTTVSHSHIIAYTKSQIGQQLTPAEMDHLKSVRGVSFDFITGVAERIFHSKNYSDINFYIKYATVCFLEEKKIPYLTLPTLYHHNNELYTIFATTQKHKNNILQYSSEGELVFNYIKQFKKYGISKSGAHLKANAHREVGTFLYKHIVNNNLIS